MGRKSLFPEDSCLILGHRGASGAFPENTLPAIEGALAAGADGVELDVRVTTDGVGVAFHDPDVSRTTDGRGLIHEMSWGQVAALKIATPGGQTGVPSLEQVVAAVGEHSALMFEVKNFPGQPGYDAVREPAVEAILEALEGSEAPVVIASFNPRNVERCRELSRGRVETGFISTAAMDPLGGLEYAVSAGHAWIVPNVESVKSTGEELITRARAAGVRVAVWVVDEPEDVELLVSWGVDALITNVPEVVVPMRDAWK